MGVIAPLARIRMARQRRLLLPIIAALALLSRTAALPKIDCPAYLHESGVANDMNVLSYLVSQESVPADLTCGSYTPLETVEGKHDTRMRIYQSDRTGATFVVFRFTVQPHGEIIHTNRTVANCTFLSPSPFSDGPEGQCVGRVHDRFQEGFVSLVNGVSDWDQYIRGKDVYVTGTSLGGGLQLFMSLWLFYTKGVVPRMSIGIAGTFIGDRAFAEAYQTPFKSVMGDRFWQTESVDARNATLFDDVAESYNAPQGEGKGQLYVQWPVLCAMRVDPLPIPEEAFGMHDLRQYHLFMNGTDCSI